MNWANRPGWPFLGRRLQLESIVSALNSPDCSGVLLVGGAGVGKTRLAHEVLRAAEGAGGVSDWLVATAAASEIPFGTLARWLPSQTGTSGPATPGIALFHSAARNLTEHAGDKPLTVGIDDVNHLDPSSAVLLHHLVHTRVAKLVLTIRTRQALPEPITSLWKDGLLQRIELGPLTRPEVEDLLAQVFDGPLDPTLTRQFWRASVGNLLYLRELVSSTQASGALSTRFGRWCLSGDLPPSMPLIDLVENRISGTSGAARDILELIAMGEPLPLNILESLASDEEISELERSELLVIEPDRRRQNVRLTHPLYADVLRARCGPRRSRELARRLAAAFSAMGLRRDSDLLRYVVWELDGGGSCDGHLLRRAAFLALESADPVLAERLGRAACRSDPGELTGLFALIEALSRQGRFEDCLEFLDAVVPGSELGRTLVQRAKAAILFSAFGDVDAANAELAALEQQVTDPECMLLIMSARANMACQAGAVSEAAGLAATILESTSNPRLVWEAKQRLCLSLAMMGRSEEALLQAAGEIIEASSRPEVVVPTDVDPLGASIALAAYHAGHLDTAQFIAEHAYANGLSLDNPVLRQLGAAARGVVAIARGSLGEASALLAEAVSLLRPTDIDGLKSFVLGMQAYAAALSGNISIAEQAVSRARAEAHPAVLRFKPLLEQGHAMTLAAAGLVTEAVAHLEASAAEARDHGQRAFEIDALFDAVRLGSGARFANRLAELAQGDDAGMPALAARYARAQALGSGKDLDSLAEDIEATGLMLVAAEAAGDAAIAHGLAGDRAAEARSLKRCADLASMCDHVSHWVLRDRFARDTLTSREREVATLVASGLANKEVATQLRVSPRTVESHLDRVYSKLGINDRSDLADIFDT